ncbi:MAG: hypothetical protein Q4C61_02940 [Lachnospiraceae bacterium]|nr:hypothetical protein [Lachnospiraceae bacterium]
MNTNNTMMTSADAVMTITSMSITMSTNATMMTNADAVMTIMIMNTIMTTSAAAAMTITSMNIITSFLLLLQRLFLFWKISAAHTALPRWRKKSMLLTA